MLTALAADVGFLPDRRIDRDHVALAADLYAIAAEDSSTTESA